MNYIGRWTVETKEEKEEDEATEEKEEEEGNTQGYTRIWRLQYAKQPIHDSPKNFLSMLSSSNINLSNFYFKISVLFTSIT